jgi:hypothetical protein
MSVLSSPQGTPERVWSLLAGLAALGGTCKRDTFDALLNPGFIRNGDEIKAETSLASNARAAATSLGFISNEKDSQALKVELPATLIGFADLVHDRLVELDSNHVDSVLLEAYAVMIAKSDQLSETSWIYQVTRDDYLELLNQGLGRREMNPTKEVAWRRWLAFLGLSVPVPTSTPNFPSPAARILRELQRADIQPKSKKPAKEFVSFLAERMPYLDGGPLFAEACRQLEHKPEVGRLSPLLSVALRDLNDDGSIKLIPIGDSGERMRLSEDISHRIDAFSIVEFFPEISS